MVLCHTCTGYVLEQMIIPSLEHGGYTYELQYNIRHRLGGGCVNSTQAAVLINILSCLDTITL